MADFDNNTSNGAPQPDLRSFIIYDKLPEGCRSHFLPDRHAEPHIKAGEWAVIDPSQREPIVGDLALIQFTGIHPDDAPRHRVIVEMKQKWGGWIVSPVQPSRLMAVAGDELVPAERIRWWDGPYSAQHLSEKLLGRVIGILGGGFEEPKRLGCG